MELDPIDIIMLIDELIVAVRHSSECFERRDYIQGLYYLDKAVQARAELESPSDD